MIRLDVISGPRSGERFEFARHQTLIVGRGADAHLQLTHDPQISRHHCLFEVNPPRCAVRDLESSNGTYVNGMRVGQASLDQGDVVRVGQTELRVSVVDSEREPDSTLARPTVTLTPAPDRGMSLPGYRIERQLGKGGMGVVYLATRLETNQQVAIKVVVPECATNEESMRRFLREAEVLRQLQHKRIVRFLEMDAACGQFYFTMEFVPAIDLEAYLTGRGPDGRIPAACGVVCQALEGLHYAHQRGIVHRDIKPANLLVTCGEGRLRTKVSDFGLAKNFQNAGFSDMTREGQAMGTIAYMAPEQITACRTSSPAVDIYSVGATLYRLIAGVHPLEFPAGRDPFAVVLEDDPVSLQERISNASSEIAAVVHRALEKDPQLRFPTARAMWSALKPFVHSRK